MIVDNAIYVDGHRTAEPVTLEEAYEAVRNRRGVAWIGLYKPTEEEFSSVSEEFGLHGLAVEDATDAHQRPKLERYGNTLFVVLKPARYLDEEERVEFGEVYLFVEKTSWLACATERHRTLAEYASNWRPTPSTCAVDQRRYCTP